MAYPGAPPEVGNEAILSLQRDHQARPQAPGTEVAGGREAEAAGAAEGDLKGTREALRRARLRDCAEPLLDAAGRAAGARAPAHRSGNAGSRSCGDGGGPQKPGERRLEAGGLAGRDVHIRVPLQAGRGRRDGPARRAAPPQGGRNQARTSRGGRPEARKRKKGARRQAGSGSHQARPDSGHGQERRKRAGGRPPLRPRGRLPKDRGGHWDRRRTRGAGRKDSRQLRVKSQKRVAQSCSVTLRLFGKSSKVKRQKSKGKSQRAKIRRQKLEARRLKTEVKSER